MKPPEVDWSVFDKFPQGTCTCRCGETYRSHTKFVNGSGIVARSPCPGCGSVLDLRRVVGDPEEFTIQNSAPPFDKTRDDES